MAPAGKSRKVWDWFSLPNWLPYKVSHVAGTYVGSHTFKVLVITVHLMWHIQMTDTMTGTCAANMAVQKLWDTVNTTFMKSEILINVWGWSVVVLCWIDFFYWCSMFTSWCNAPEENMKCHSTVNGKIITANWFYILSHIGFGSNAVYPWNSKSVLWTQTLHPPQWIMSESPLIIPLSETTWNVVAIKKRP